MSCDAAAKSSETVIGDISRELAAAAVRKEHQAEIAAFLQKTRSAADEYTVPKWTDLVTAWTRQDGEIEKLINIVVQRENWRSGLADVCARYTDIRLLQERLAGTAFKPPDAPAAAAHGLYWTRAWQQENRDFQKRACARARLKLAAWEKPAQTLGKILADNDTLIKKGYETVNGPDPAVIFLVFFKLVPMHLLIRPAKPAPSVKPLVERTEGQKSDDALKKNLEECMKVVDGLLRPQPSLIAPSEYDKKVEEILRRLSVATDQLAAAEGELKKTEETIARGVKQLEEKKKSIERDATTALQEAAPRPPN